MADREKMAVVWKRILFSYLEFECNRSTISCVYLTVFMQRAQLHIQSSDYDEIGTIGGDGEAVYCFYQNSNPRRCSLRNQEIDRRPERRSAIVAT
jgi:hypothetical protein